MKRILLAADTHCGHRMGLVPPQWQEDAGCTARVQRELWNAFSKAIGSLGEIYEAVIVGDLIDGGGRKSGGTELIRPKPSAQHRQSPVGLQLDIAEAVIKAIGAKSTFIVQGTEYHGTDADGISLEAELASRLGAGFGMSRDFECNGLRFSCKHHIPVSSAPQARATALLRAQLWDMINATMEGGERADVVVRAHAHYFMHVSCDAGHAMVLPALQAASRYAHLRLDGLPSLGFVVFDVENRDNYKITPHLFKLKAMARKFEKI